MLYTNLSADTGDNTMSRFSIAVFLPLLLVTGEIYSAPDSSPAVLTVPASRSVITDTYLADARIEAVHQATVAAETTGRIKEIYFDVDDVVEAGSVLLRFTDSEQQAQLSRAQAAQREAEARLQEAQEEHARVSRIYAQRLVPKSTMDKAEADLKAAQQRLVASQAGVRQAREQLEYTVVRAPYAGIVVQRHVSVGEPVRPGTPLMSGFSLAKLRATATVPQAVVEAVRKHSQAIISLDSVETGVPVSGKALTIYPYADSASHSFTVRMQLEAVPEGFYPGMFAKAAFAVGEKSVLMIPLSAVVRRSEVTAVYVLDAQGRVSFRMLRLGRQLGDSIQVLAGLEAGEQVAIDPVHAGIVLKQQRAGSVPGSAQ